MSVLHDYVVRYSNQDFYSFELVIALAAWVLVLLLWWRDGDVRPLAAYLIAGLYDSCVELLASASGVRVVPAVALFGVWNAGFPVVPVIQGFFEGGVLLLAGYQLVRGLLDRDRRALRLGLGITLGLAAIIALASLGAGARPPAASTAPTARALFSRGPLAILAVSYAVSSAYAMLDRRDRRALRGLALWYASVAAVAATWYTPAFLAGLRGVARLHDGNFVPVGFAEQIAVLYGYSIVFEASGFYLPVYVLLRLCRLL